jgi:predicted house-cleaning noncanonical NTP pyrophosphatase (MazG superfamily)
LDKLVEEANEALAAAPDDLITELADIHEVIDAIVAAYAVDRNLLRDEQLRRRAERGSFEKKLRLLWVSQ